MVAGVRLRTFALVVVASSVAIAARAAEPAPIRASLAWARADGAESCIAAPELARAIEARLGYAVFGSPTSADVTLEGSIAPAAPGPGYRASFRVLDAKGAVLGERKVEGADPSCRALDDRAVLVASILVDDAAREKKLAASAPATVSASATAPLPSGSASAAPSVVPSSAPVAPSASATPPREAPDPGVKLAVDVGLGVTTGLQPGVGLGLAATAFVRPPRFVPFYVGAGLYPATRSTVGRGGEIAADVKLGTAGLCPLALGEGRASLLVCGGVLVGGLDARGDGFDESYGGLAVLVSGVLQARATVRLVGPLALYGALGGHFALVRAEIAYREGLASKVGYASDALGLFSELGLGLRFP